MKNNIDPKTVNGFGHQWRRFNQAKLSEQESKAIFDTYFSAFPWDILPGNSVGFDIGCGSGRWAKLVSPRVGRLHCIDPSDALYVAKKNLSSFNNCEFHRATVDAIPLEDGTMDFGYSLGVLHHVPDVKAAIEACTKKLKPNAPFLVYLYYNMDNRPWWYRLIWHVSNLFRKIISRLPYSFKFCSTQVIAVFVYFPLARLSRVVEKIGLNVRNFPLSAYRNRSFYTMRTDALDRFGTRLEKRFSSRQIKAMMEQAGLERVTISSSEPFWCAVGYRRSREKKVD